MGELIKELVYGKRWMFLECPVFKTIHCSAK
jgi:hypothetical protein